MEAIQALVVSEETAAGLQPINDDRQQRGFPPLEVRMLLPLCFAWLVACLAFSCVHRPCRCKGRQ